MIKKISVFILILLFIPNMVLAHPGKTNGSGCHYCRTNCTKWGLNDNEYHCHSGDTYTNSKGQTYNSSGNLISSATNPSTDNIDNSTPQQPIKNSDNTLKSINVNGENIEVNDTMYYVTYADSIDISLETNDVNATYDISDTTLINGINDIYIKVTAQNGNIKEYILTVERKQASNNTNIEIYIDDEKINFISDKASVYVSSDTHDLNYYYKVEDTKTNVKVEGDKNLKQGENTVIFTVTAEDGTQKKYEVTVDKYTKFMETIIILITIIIFLTPIIGSIIVLIYYYIKKRKK